MIIAALSAAGICFLLWLLFTFAVYALPFYAGLSAAIFAFHHNAGLLGAAVVGVMVAGLVFGGGQVAFDSLHSPAARGFIALLYAAPAAVAGFYAVRGLAKATGTGEPWATMFCVLGGAIVAGVAWARLTALGPTNPMRGGEQRALVPRQPIGAANDS